MRKSIENITNELAIGQGLDLDIMALYNAILDYNKKAKTICKPRSNKYEIKNGCLFINDTLITRVAPLPARVKYNAAALYYEGRILARQEAYYNN